MNSGGGNLPTEEFDYKLPPELIAQRPLAERSSSRLLVLNRSTGKVEHRCFTDLLDYLRPDDCLVVNETKVRRAGLFGRKSTGAAVEILLLTEVGPDTWEVLCRPAKRLRQGAEITFDHNLRAVVVGEREAGKRVVKFASDTQVAAELHRIGQIALPPYIHEPLSESGRYQTVFAKKIGSAAAPTAGLHFTRSFLKRIEDTGVKVAALTLDIGLDTFRPIQVDKIEDHRMHSETYEITPEAAAAVRESKQIGGKVIAVGTTTVRALESSALKTGSAAAGRSRTELFIREGFEFKVVDKMLTNFHLPRSTLLVLVSAFAGRENIRQAYERAIDCSYRFFSFGDAMLIV